MVIISLQRGGNKFVFHQSREGGIGKINMNKKIIKKIKLNDKKEKDWIVRYRFSVVAASGVNLGPTLNVDDHERSFPMKRFAAPTRCSKSSPPQPQVSPQNHEFEIRLF